VGDSAAADYEPVINRSAQADAGKTPAVEMEYSQ